MSEHEVNRTRWQRFRQSLSAVPIDGVLVLGYVAAAAALLYYAGLDGLARTVIAVPFVLFLPGYALVAALFPAAPSFDADARERSVASLVRGGAPGWYERLALSFAASLALLPPLGLILATTSWGFHPTAVFVSLGGFVALVTLIAMGRRVRLPSERRFRLPWRSGASDLYRSVFDAGERFDGVLNAALLLSLLVALSTLGYALAVPQSAQGSSDLRVLSENEDGELVAAGHPDQLTPGDPEELTVAVTNDEGEEITYTVVVDVQHVEESGDELEIVDSQELARMELTAEDGETVTRRHGVASPIEGDNLRINYYLYRGDAPDDADAESAYRHVWFTADGE